MFGIKELKEKVESCEKKNDDLLQLIKGICPHANCDYQQRFLGNINSVGDVNPLNYYFKVCKLCKKEIYITEKEYYQEISAQKIKEGKDLIAEGKKLLEGTK